MNQFLDNPVYYALASGDSEKAFGTDNVKYFDPAVSPFAGFKENLKNGFQQLATLLPEGRDVLFATRKKLTDHPGWHLKKLIEGAQFIYLSKQQFTDDFSELLPLKEQHVPQMIELAQLTRPGPFGLRTIEFGNYYGIFDGSQNLLAMAGNRLHVYGYVEISAVCTHPDHTGRGYAARLLKHGINSILKEEKVAFLHVRADNKRAIDLYERLGFLRNGNMNFYVLQRNLG